MMSDVFRCFRQGLRWLLQFPGWTATLVGLGTLLGALAPWLQVQARLPDHLAVEAALAFVTALPLALYAIPRFALRLDARDGGSPLNPEATWQQTFESRWLAMLGAKLVVGLVVGLGLLLFIAPGILALAVLGWAPSLVFLRGYNLGDAARASLRIMSRHAHRVILVALGGFLATQFLTLGVATLLPISEANLAPLLRLRQPGFWVLNAWSVFLSVWFNGVLLALFHQVEQAAQPTDVEA